MDISNPAKPAPRNGDSAMPSVAVIAITAMTQSHIRAAMGMYARVPSIFSSSRIPSTVKRATSAAKYIGPASVQATMRRTYTAPDRARNSILFILQKISDNSVACRCGFYLVVDAGALLYVGFGACVIDLHAYLHLVEPFAIYAVDV